MLAMGLAPRPSGVLVKSGDYFSHFVFMEARNRPEASLCHLAVHPWASDLPSVCPCFPHLRNEDGTDPISSGCHRGLNDVK